MSAWFSKVFKGKSEAAANPLPGPVEVAVEEEEPVPAEAPAAGEPEVEAPRRVVYGEVLACEEQTSAFSDDVRIKANINEEERTCTFLVDRPVLKGLSFCAPDSEAGASSPLASALFDLGGVGSVLLHDMTVTVTRDSWDDTSWEDYAKAVGAQLRAHLCSGAPSVDPAFLDAMPPEDDIRQRLQVVLDEEINPAIASHSGMITLGRIEGNTAYITMGGGCQGCAASAVTLRQGVHTAFRKAVPQMGAILDETDHAAGKNPFFSEMPAGMEG